MIEIIYTNSKKEIQANDKIVDLFSYTGPLSVEEPSFSFIQKLEQQNIRDKTIEDFYTYDGIPIYYFIRPTFYGKLKNIIFYVELLEKIVTRENNDYVLRTDDKVLYDVATGIFNIKSEMVKENKAEEKIFSFRSFLNSCKRYINGTINLSKYVMKAKKKRVLAITHSADINFINNKHDKGYYDTQLGPVITKLKSSYDVLEVQLLNNKNQIEKSLKYKNKSIPFEIFILYKKFILKSIAKQINFKNNIDYFDAIDYKYKKYNLKPIIFENIIKNFEHECFNYLVEILSAEKFIRRYNFSKCLVAGEGDRGRCFVVASKRLGVPCYAIQHGIINETSPNYIIDCKSKADVVPTVSFLWGRKYQEILINNTTVYNKLNTKIVGQVRTDLLKQYQNNFAEKHNSIRILYATQYLKDLLEPATVMLFKSLNLLKVEYELVIKLHPADSFIDYYKEMINLYNIKNVRIIKDEDLYNLISWSDIIVSVHSTVVLEGALMGKPSICIILPKYCDEGGFVKDGVSIGASDEYQLANYMVAKNVEYMDNLKTYITDNFYMVDGKVADRIAEKIKREI